MDKSETGWRLSDAGYFTGECRFRQSPGRLSIAPSGLDASARHGKGHGGSCIYTNRRERPNRNGFYATRLYCSPRIPRWFGEILTNGGTLLSVYAVLIGRFVHQAHWSETCNPRGPQATEDSIGSLRVYSFKGFDKGHSRTSISGTSAKIYLVPNDYDFSKYLPAS